MRQVGKRALIPAHVGCYSIIEKLPDHDIGVSILRV